MLVGVLAAVLLLGTVGVLAAKRFVDGLGGAAIEALQESDANDFTFAVDDGDVAIEGGLIVEGATIDDDPTWDGLMVGDCVAGGVVVDCDQPHSSEVFHTVAVASDERPDFSTVFDVSTGECTEVFETYVGVDYFESEFFLDAYPSSLEAWAQGDRTIRCALYDPFDDVSGSAAGVAR